MKNDRLPVGNGHGTGMARFANSGAPQLFLRSAVYAGGRFRVTMSTAASDRRRVLADLARERQGGQSSGGLLRRTVIGLLVAALLGLLLAWFLGFFSVPREVLEIRGIVDGEIAELRKVARNEVPLSYDSPGVGAVFDRVRDLPPDLRRQAGREVGRLFAAREQAEMESYFNLPPERRQAELDRRIKAEEDRRKAREAERAERERQRPAASAGQPPAGGPGGAGGPPNGRGRGRSTTEDERNARSKSRIDRSSPDERARRTEYRRAIDERRTQLGLPTRGGRW